MSSQDLKMTAAELKDQFTKAMVTKLRAVGSIKVRGDEDGEYFEVRQRRKYGLTEYAVFVEGSPMTPWRLMDNQALLNWFAWLREDTREE